MSRRTSRRRTVLPTIDVRELAAIFAGGALGALARTELARHLAHGGARWPWSTFIANVAGAFLLGYFATRLQERLAPSTYPRPLLGTGFCGALTTFSTVQLELFEMIDGHRYGLALGYASASIAAGMLAVAAATAITRRVRLIV